MGVKTCSRVSCDNIMCDRHSTRFGYLCDECFEELVHKGVRTDIEDFMCGSSIPLDEKLSRQYFDGVFPQ